MIIIKFFTYFSIILFSRKALRALRVDLLFWSLFLNLDHFIILKIGVSAEWTFSQKQLHF